MINSNPVFKHSLSGKDKPHLIYFEEVFHDYYSPLCNYAFKIVNDFDLAEDLVQNLFLQLFEKKSLLGLEHPERYLLRGIKFKCIDYIRSKNARQQINFDTLDIEDEKTNSEIDEEDVEPLLHFFAAKLPPKTRQVFLLSRDSGLTYKEIAAKLNISEKTVENQMGRALRHMKALLKSHNYLGLIPFLLT